MSKDGHIGVVKNTGKPISKINQTVVKKIESGTTEGESME